MKRGFELAVNTLVVIILGTIITIGGIMLVRNITESASTTLEEVPSKMEEQVVNLLLNTKQRITVLKNVMTSSGREPVRYTLAFQNQLEFPRSEFGVFEPFITLAPEDAQQCVTPNENSPWGNPRSWWHTGHGCGQGANADECYAYHCPEARTLAVTDGHVYPVDRYEAQAFFVVVEVPPAAPAGEYTLSVPVKDMAHCNSAGVCQDTTGGDPYAIAKLYLNVE